MGHKLKFFGGSNEYLQSNARGKMRICKVTRGLQHDHLRADTLWRWCNKEDTLNSPETTFRRQIYCSSLFYLTTKQFLGFSNSFWNIRGCVFPVAWPLVGTWGFTPSFLRKVSWVIVKSFLIASLCSFKTDVQDIFATFLSIAFIFINYNRQWVQDIFVFLHCFCFDSTN